MSWRVKVRKKNLNGDEIMLQRSSMPLLMKIFVTPVPLLWPLFWFDYWRDWKLINNTLYENEQNIARHVAKIEKLLDERKIIKATLKQEKKEIDDSKRYRSGESAPWFMEVGFSDWLFFKRYPDLDPPEGSWRKLLDKSVLDDKPKATGIRDRLGIDAHPQSSDVTAYTLDDCKSLKLGGNFDEVLTFKDNQGKSQKSNNGSKRNGNWRKRRQGESPEEHQERLDLADSGDFVEDMD